MFEILVEVLAVEMDNEGTEYVNSFFEYFRIWGGQFLMELSFDGEEVLVSVPAHCFGEEGRVEFAYFALVHLLLDCGYCLGHLRGAAGISFELAGCLYFFPDFLVLSQKFHFDLFPQL